MERTSEDKILTEAELIERLKDGNHGAYTEIYNRYYYLIFVFAYKKLRDEDQAKDIVQELFVDLWVKKEHILTTQNFASYLFTATRNKILNLFKHEKVALKYIDSLRDYVNSGVTAHADYLVREKQMKAYIEKEIQALPKKMRQIFELSRKDNLSNRKIAENLQTTESNVSQHLANATKILRTKLGSILFLTIL